LSGTSPLILVVNRVLPVKTLAEKTLAEFTAFTGTQEEKIWG